MIDKTILNPPTLAEPSGYANGILTQGGRLLFLAGQTAIDSMGKIVAPSPDIVPQFRQALSNLLSHLLRQVLSGYDSGGGEGSLGRHRRDWRLR